MARAALRLRPDGIYEIVGKRSARRLAAALSALLATSAFGLVVAAAASAFVGSATALSGGAALTALLMLGLFVRARLRVAAMPLASTIELRTAAARALSRGGARDAGA